MSNKRVNLSGENLTAIEVAEHFEVLQKALRNLYHHPPDWLRHRFPNEPPSAMASDLDNRLLEIERDGSLTLLAAIEASFRVDFLDRVYNRRKDALSRACRTLYANVGARPKLEDELFALWLDYTHIAPSLISDLRGAFNYRHWLAHGRYWTPRFGRRYDFDNVFLLAQAAVNALDIAVPLERK